MAPQRIHATDKARRAQHESFQTARGLKCLRFWLPDAINTRLQAELGRRKGRGERVSQQGLIAELVAAGLADTAQADVSDLRRELAAARREIARLEERAVPRVC